MLADSTLLAVWDDFMTCSVKAQAKGRVVGKMFVGTLEEGLSRGWRSMHELTLRRKLLGECLVKNRRMPDSMACSLRYSI